MKRNFIIYSVLVLVFSTNACFISKGKVYDSALVSINKNVSIKITAYHEKGILLIIPGSYHIFESKDKTKDSTNKIFEFRHDDPVKIKVENIKVISKDLSYFWMGWKFASTNDGGKTWFVWNAETSKNFDINYGLIENVRISKEGQGKMYFNNLAKERGSIPFLTTKDFGKTWQKALKSKNHGNSNSNK